MTDFDFVEIGTSDFDTLAETMPDSFGISIEPLPVYLDKLPNRSNLIKVNCAISASNQEHEVDVFYIPPDVLETYNHLPDWLRGCNSVNKLHLQHRALAIEHLVQKVKVRAVPLGSLLVEHSANSIGFLKLDTEGMDCAILNNFFNFLTGTSSKLWPKKILFETNELTDIKEIDTIINLYSSHGYSVVRNGGNTELYRIAKVY